MITKCPKCQTVFNVRQEQLSAANGLVRCGGCMTVFNAVSEANNSTEPAKGSGPAASNPLKNKTPNKKTSNSQSPNKVAPKRAASPPTPKKPPNPKPAQAPQAKQSPKEPGQEWSQMMNNNLESIDKDLNKLESEVKPGHTKQNVERQGVKRQAEQQETEQQEAEQQEPERLEDSLFDPAKEMEKLKNVDIPDDFTDSFKGLPEAAGMSDPFALETGGIQPNSPQKHEDESWVEQLLVELDTDSKSDVYSVAEDDSASNTAEPVSPTPKSNSTGYNKKKRRSANQRQG